jgi:hypothetical protein
VPLAWVLCPRLMDAAIEYALGLPNNAKPSDAIDARIKLQTAIGM